MKLLIDRNPEEEDVVISLAQELWCEIDSRDSDWSIGDRH